MQSSDKLRYASLINPTPEEMFSPMEVYHENSKLQPTDYEFLSKIVTVNTSSPIRRLITRPFVNYPGHQSVPLPKEFPPASKDFESIVTGRRSEHSFSGKAITTETLAKLLFLGDGITGEMPANDGNTFSLRTAPSGGGLYPIEMYCFSLRTTDLPNGSWFYNPLSHQLELLQEQDFTEALAGATNLQKEARGAAVCVALVGVLPRSSFKYGQRAYRFLLLEAGHIAQNILLAAESLGLGGLPVGGFFDDKINDLLSLDGCNEFAVYLLMLGEKKPLR